MQHDIGYNEINGVDNMRKAKIKSVFSSVDDYGEVYINLDKILKEKNITHNRLANSIGTDFDLVSRYSKNKIVRTDLNILARMCYVLDCNISDILVYKPPKQKDWQI